LAKKDMAASKEAAARFAFSLSTLASLSRSAAVKRVRKPSTKPLSKDDEGALLLAREIALPGRTELALCYIVLDGLKALCASGAKAPSKATASEGARRIVDRYCLDRKLREALRASGMHGDEAYKGIALAKALLPRIADVGPASSGKMPPLDPAALVEDCAADEELRSLLGYNVFDGPPGSTRSVSRRRSAWALSSAHLSEACAGPEKTEGRRGA